MSKQIFKCRICGEKYDHDKMASEKDVSICKWCAQDKGYRVEPHLSDLSA